MNDVNEVKKYVMNLPDQSPPVCRNLLTTRAASGALNGAGVEAAQTSCDALTGPSQQMCYALEYGVRM